MFFDLGLMLGAVLPILGISWLLRRLTGRRANAEKPIFWSVVEAGLVSLVIASFGFADGDYSARALLGTADRLLLSYVGAVVLAYAILAAYAILMRSRNRDEPHG